MMYSTQNKNKKAQAIKPSVQQNHQIPEDKQAICCDLEAVFLRHKEFAKNEGIESLEVRQFHLDNLKLMLIENQAALIDAINKDYGYRSYHETLIAEVLTVISDISRTRKQLKKWLKTQKRHIDRSMYPGATNMVIPQPLGVVGLIIPWNFPLNLTFSGLIAAFAAGNRAMVKLSENSQHFADLLIKISPNYFVKEKLTFFKETGEVGIEFSKLPFDHLMFTGSSETGRKVMAAAAQNLTPVTLELGGKSPAVIAPDYPMKKAVERLLLVKQFNAGQICTCVDYVFVHKSQLSSFVDLAKAWVDKHVPDIHSPDYTSIIDDKSFARLQYTLEDAQSKGAHIVPLNKQKADPKTRKFPLYLICDSTTGMLIESREIFGPLLMVKTYLNPEDVTHYIADKPRPLAFYPFSYDQDLLDYYLEHVMSGGVSINDALFHVAQHDLPFGGVGASGMGHYHGYEGFLTFSKLRPVFHQSRFSAMKWLAPPYTKKIDKILNFILKMKSKS